MTNIRYKGKLVPVGQMPWLPQPERVLGPVGSFNLFDPPLCVFPAPKRRANRAVPRITVLGAWTPSPPPPPPEPGPRIQDRDANAPVNAIHVCRRLRALKAALDDMPGHAIRFARREARLESSWNSHRGDERVRVSERCRTAACRLRK